MSGQVTYASFVKVAVEEHPGTSPAVSIPGFTFEPTQGCRRTMADSRITFRPFPSGFRLYYQRNPQAADPLLGGITARTRFSFIVRHAAPRLLFADFQPDLMADEGPQLYLDNLTPGGAVQGKTTLTVDTFVKGKDAAKVLPSQFTVSVDTSGATPPTVVRIQDMHDGTLVVESALEGSGDVGIAKVDLSLHAAGPYALVTDGVGAVPRLIYVDDSVAGASALGVVDLYHESAQDTVPDPLGLEYAIRFKKH